MIAIWQSVKNRIDCLLHPASCLLCDTYHENRMPWLCVECGERIGSECSVYQNQLDFGDARQFSMQIFSGWQIGDQLRTLIHELKYEKHKQIGPYLGSMLARQLAETTVLSARRPLVPIPLHRKRLRERGFNQSESIASGLARLHKNPILAACVQRAIHTEQQVYLNKAERQRNVKGAFVVKNTNRHALHGMDITLVDDVMTTGATLSECAKMLYAAGARQVDAITLTSMQL